MAQNTVDPTRDSNHDPAGVAALLAVTGIDRGPSHGWGRLHELVRAIVDSVGGRAGAVQVVDDRIGRFALAAAVNLQSAAAELHNAPLLDGIAGRVLEEDLEIVLLDEDPVGMLPPSLVEAGMRHAIGLPVHGRHRVIGAIWVASPEPLASDHLRRHAARVGAERLGWALEESRLYETLERAMGQILEADERMLGRIGLDIHDGPTQLLSVALLEVQLLDVDLDDEVSRGAALPAKLKPALARIYETLGGAVHEMRELIGQLRPAQFENRALPDILADAVHAFEARTGGHVDYRIVGEFPENAVSISQRITFYRTLQEALTNATRHGGAREATVLLDGDEDGTTMEVIDNGSGFDVADVRRARTGAPDARFGIFGMRDRAELLGGTCDIQSTVGAGTRVIVFLPRWRGEQGTAGPGLA